MQKPRPDLTSEAGVDILIGRLPTLPHTCACSTIGAERLNFRVRDGNGWNPLAKITRKFNRDIVYRPVRQSRKLLDMSYLQYNLNSIDEQLEMQNVEFILWSSRTSY